MAHARDIKALGVSGLLVFPIGAYQGLPLDSEVPVRYHAAIGDATGMPLILFNLQPALGGVNFEPETLDRLCRVAQVVGIKEASFDAQLFIQIRDVVKAARPDCVFLTGNDNFIYESFVLGAEELARAQAGEAERRRLALQTGMVIATAIGSPTSTISFLYRS